MFKQIMINTFFRLLLVSLFLFFSINLSHSQDSLKSEGSSRHVPRVGVFGGPQFNFYSGTFEVYDNNALCGTFTTGKGTAIAVGALADIPITQTFFIRARAGYSDYTGTFTSSVRLASAILPNGELTDATADETLDAKLSYISFNPSALYYPFQSFPLAFQCGPSVGIISKKTFTQKEKLTAPLSATFKDGTQDHTIVSGDIHATNGVRLGLNLGAEYDLFLSQNLIASPMISYDFPITKVTSDTKWYASALDVGIAIKFALMPAPVYVPKHPPPPPKKKKPAPPIVELKKEGTTTLGSKTSADEIVAEEIRTTERRPLLPYIFFDQGDANRPLRQTLLTSDEARNFSSEKIKGNDLELYPHLLNIIAERLKKYPNTTITLTGTNNGFEIEKNNTILSHQRAEIIKKYFVDTWKIEPNRMTIQSRNLPFDPSAPEAPEGREENRRVEITSSSIEVLHPIARDEKQNSLSLQSIDFLPKVSSEAGIAHWDFSVKQDNKILYQANGTTNDIPAIMRWDIQNKPITPTDRPVTVDFFVRDYEGQEKAIHDEIPVRTLTIEKKREERIGDMLVNRSGLIVFDFDKATLSERNKKIIDEIKPAITPQSKVTIIGYTDALGDADHNWKLSQQRAQNVRDALASAVSDDRVVVEGKGSKQLLYPNDTPEGRFYCRMVQIIIETPVK